MLMSALLAAGRPGAPPAWPAARRRRRQAAAEARAADAEAARRLNRRCPWSAAGLYDDGVEYGAPLTPAIEDVVELQGRGRGARRAHLAYAYEYAEKKAFEDVATTPTTRNRRRGAAGATAATPWTGNFR